MFRSFASAGNQWIRQITDLKRIKVNNVPAQPSFVEIGRAPLLRKLLIVRSLYECPEEIGGSQYAM
jgi:hypothetical protein